MRQEPASAAARLRVVTLILGLGLLSTTGHAAEIVVPGLSDPVADAWIEADLLILRTEGGRLYSVPLQSVMIESRPARRSERRAAHSLDEILELLDAGVSESTVRAYLETKKGASAPYEITADAVIALKKGGASDSFIQYLIHYGRTSPKTAYITWTGPQWPPREKESASGTPESLASETPNDHAVDSEGIPLFPYVFSGFGACCPVYPFPPIYPGETPGGSGRQPLRPGYYWPQARSIMGRSRRPHDGPGPAPRPSPPTGGGRLFLRWNGPMQTGASGLDSPASRAPSRVNAPLTSSPTRRIGAGSYRGAGNVGAPTGGSSGGRSLMGNATSRASGRSLTKKK